MRRLLAAMVLGFWLFASTIAAEAKLHRQSVDVFDTRHDVSESRFLQATSESVRTAVRSSQRKSKTKQKRERRDYVPVRYAEAQIVSHPPGCPARRFCGCGVAVHVFGAPIRDLWLAANWLRFPRAEPAPGMVAARRGHVFAILEVKSDRTVLAYDPNSGQRRTRIWLRSLAGYTVVNPRGGTRYAYAG